MNYLKFCISQCGGWVVLERVVLVLRRGECWRCGYSPGVPALSRHDAYCAGQTWCPHRRSWGAPRRRNPGKHLVRCGAETTSRRDSHQSQALPYVLQVARTGTSIHLKKIKTPSNFHIPHTQNKGASRKVKAGLLRNPTRWDSGGVVFILLVHCFYFVGSGCVVGWLIELVL